MFKIKKMQTQKMSLANIKGKLSRTEMKNIMAGSGCSVGKSCLTYAFPQPGFCRPGGGYPCLCKQTNGSLAGESLDCTDVA